MNRWLLWTGMLLGLLVSDRAQAGPIFSYAFDQPSYNVAVFGTVDVTVYFQESDTGPPTSLPNAYLASQGLLSVGTRVDSSYGAEMTATVDVTPNPAFASFTRSVTSGGGNLFRKRRPGSGHCRPGQRARLPNRGRRVPVHGDVTGHRNPDGERGRKWTR